MKQACSQQPHLDRFKLLAFSVFVVPRVGDIFNCCVSFTFTNESVLACSVRLCCGAALVSGGASFVVDERIKIYVCFFNGFTETFCSQQA